MKCYKTKTKIKMGQLMKDKVRTEYKRGHVIMKSFKPARSEDELQKLQKQITV